MLIYSSVVPRPVDIDYLKVYINCESGDEAVCEIITVLTTA